ncbi:MAG: bifunctional pyr operon transcriptional regulator/uracil phosphoribosyltransferase PyrR [Caldiserica bacterium]|mgnify:CR=1 FL=1|nr:MAG: bifunctional pyr operon transcriptional regulator/uracil phosphoribosyltransferase PyrR [Caldisericota bacterium]
MNKNIISDKNEISRIIKRLSAEILEDLKGSKDLVLIGIRTKGVYIAKRIRKEIEKQEKRKVPLGILDITLYRDDIERITEHPKAKETIIDFNIENKDIVLVDDVIWTGRTVRAAIDEIMDFGRPRRIKLCVLVDRGERELPIEPNYVGKKVVLRKNEWVEVYLKETDGMDGIVILSKRR